jgi:hypothetical protein
MSDEMFVQFVCQVFNLMVILQLQERNPKQSTLLRYRKINNSSFKGLLDTHINTSAFEEVPPNPANTQTQQSLPIYTTPAPQPRSATHTCSYRHPITDYLIRDPLPIHSDPSTSNGHPKTNPLSLTHPT